MVLWLVRSQHHAQHIGEVAPAQGAVDDHWQLADVDMPSVLGAPPRYGRQLGDLLVGEPKRREIKDRHYRRPETGSGTTSAPGRSLLPLIISAIRSAARFATSRIGSGARWAYRSVVLEFRCPSTLPTMKRLSPDATATDATLCLRSCKRVSSKPAALR